LLLSASLGDLQKEMASASGSNKSRSFKFEVKVRPPTELRPNLIHTVPIVFYVAPIGEFDLKPGENIAVRVHTATNASENVLIGEQTVNINSSDSNALTGYATFENLRFRIAGSYNLVFEVLIFGSAFVTACSLSFPVSVSDEAPTSQTPSRSFPPQKKRDTSTSFCLCSACLTWLSDAREAEFLQSEYHHLFTQVPRAQVEDWVAKTRQDS
jgi:hypothetical protein